MELKNTYNDKNDFNGIYRGVVIWNDDPQVKGRIKVFVPGIYSDKYSSSPEYLPWARPFSPTFGGGAHNDSTKNSKLLNSETGWCSVPHSGDLNTGSQVFVFFENGDINYPVYFGVAQSGEGWFSEHPNQHSFRSDNVTVTIDEETTDSRSTSKYDTFTSSNSKVAHAALERTAEMKGLAFNKTNGTIDDIETRINIEIEATDKNAVNLNIHGNVNMHIDGDWFVEHIGNYYEYRKGDRFIKQDGNTYIEENGVFRNILNGDKTEEHIGKYVMNHKGDSLITKDGKFLEQIDGDATRI